MILTPFASTLHSAMARIKREFAVEIHPYPGLVMYEVSLDDLNQLEQETLTVSEDFSFALAMATAAVSFTITLATVKLDPGKLNEFFWIVTIISYIGMVFFGIRWLANKRRFISTITRIKESSAASSEPSQHPETPHG